jgi:hypothetical protein
MISAPEIMFANMDDPEAVNMILMSCLKKVE